MTLEERLRSKIKYWYFCSSLGKDLKSSSSEVVVPFNRSSISVPIFMYLYAHMHVHKNIYICVQL